MDSITPNDHSDTSDEDVDFIDVITIDMFNVAIPVFVNAGQMLQALDKICVDVDTRDSEFKFDGMACLYKDDEGCPVYAVYLHPDSTVDVWAHEASHLVDMVFETMGIYAGYESTETRAYMLQHIFRSMVHCMTVYKEEQSELAHEGTIH